jgi:sugar phosphate isomerase/epimerase
MSIRPCVFTDEVDPDFDEAVRLSVEAGAAGLELRGKLFDRSIGQIGEEEVERIQAICRRYGAQVAVLGSPVGKCSLEDAEERRQHQALFARMTALARAFGTPLIRGFALWRPERNLSAPASRVPDALRPDLDRYLSEIVAFLAPIVAQAEREGVRYCLETEGATLVGTCSEASRVMDALGRPPALGIAWDVNNGLSCGESPFPEGYSLIRDRVYHVHVKPNPQGSLTTVGDSSLTYRQVLETLRQDGYNGWASIEHWGSPAAMLKGLRELTPLLAKVNGAGSRG